MEAASPGLSQDSLGKPKMGGGLRATPSSEGWEMRPLGWGVMLPSFNPILTLFPVLLRVGWNVGIPRKP